MNNQNSDIEKKIPSVNTQSPLVWMDLEMSGLDPEHDTILEIATLITDNTLNIIAQGPHLVIHQPNSILDGMDDCNKRHHKASGLIKAVKNSKISLHQAESQTLEFIQKYCTMNESPLCGNSISQDRRFLRKYTPTLQRFLHYRNIDVSSIKEVIARWYPQKFSPPRKKGSHQALQDIQESIQELSYYRRHFFSPS
jgi:oligoribonuclease